jgi:hypothetical protein
MFFPFMTHDPKGDDARSQAGAPSPDESPSLGTRRDGGQAFEVKFLIDEELAAEVLRWARVRLAPDLHASTELDGAYATTSLYTDTSSDDVYLRSPRYKRRKFRVRRYGNEDWVFLERKQKSGDKVSKRRDRVPVEELARLAPPLAVADWTGQWFHQRIHARRLLPACLIGYERHAFFGAGVDGPLRLTMDRNVRGIPWDRWEVASAQAGHLLFPSQVILELKFLAALPTEFKQLVADLRLQPRAVSKYRACREIWRARAAS